ncbi:hypothetical protein DFP94_1011046 [Fontibacillus phaseoli]|uniref:Uncharacterized protein n=1 Tax=Fontibacillus phaseoli TaxID=1416533 RepID=A0A369BSQ2_9BACL|nr:hypothetical protein [Fontibacillus phaseoli]RCX23447.1 hypothetical protein DFP94_1011046 [Fontibacillus phaseoli]
MLKKSSLYVSTLILGMILIGVSFLFPGEHLRALSGIMIGIGGGLAGLSVSNLIMKYYERKHPETAKQKTIEYKDERNTFIRYRAKAKAADINQWFIIAIALMLIIIDAPLWSTLAVVFVYLLYHLISTWFTIRYQNEM